LKVKVLLPSTVSDALGFVVVVVADEVVVVVVDSRVLVSDP
jgi:hypothetical protein